MCLADESALTDQSVRDRLPVCSFGFGLSERILGERNSIPLPLASPEFEYMSRQHFVAPRSYLRGFHHSTDERQDEAACIAFLTNGCVNGRYPLMTILTINLVANASYRTRWVLRPPSAAFEHDRSGQSNTENLMRSL